MPCDAMRCRAMPCDAMRCRAMPCDAVQGRYSDDSPRRLPSPVRPSSTRPGDMPDYDFCGLSNSSGRAFDPPKDRKAATVCGGGGGGGGATCETVGDATVGRCVGSAPRRCTDCAVLQWGYEEAHAHRRAYGKGGQLPRHPTPSYPISVSVHSVHWCTAAQRRPGPRERLSGTCAVLDFAAVAYVSSPCGDRILTDGWRLS